MEQVRFEIEVGPLVVGVVPQPIETVSGTRVQRRDQIWVFFNNDPLSNPAAGPVSFNAGSTLPVVNPQFYKLIYTADTVENTDDDPILPINVTYDPTLNRAVLTYPGDLSEIGQAALNGHSGTYRLRVGSGDPLPSPPVILPSGGGGGDTFNQAISLGTPFSTGTQSVIVTEGLIQNRNPIIPNWPGAADAAGSRENRRDVELVGRADTQTGINIFPYNFATLYGTDPQGNLAENAITEAQKQRTRQVLSLYAERLGVQFVETERDGLQIVTGDLRTIVISTDTGAGSDTPLQHLSCQRSRSRQGTAGVGCRRELVRRLWSFSGQSAQLVCRSGARHRQPVGYR